MRCGNWTADGRYFIFETIHGDVSTLWVIPDAEDLWHRVSEEPVQLTHGEISAESPTPSRDGRKLYFVGVIHRGEVTRYDPRTHSATPYLPGLSAEGLSLSRDGNRMAYVSYPEFVLCVSKPDGTDRRQLTTAPLNVIVPNWSPDGSQIAFEANLPGKPIQVFTIPSEGGKPMQLTSGDGPSQDPSWSPDGGLLAFSAGYDPDSTIPLHILDLKTRQTSEVPNSAGLFSPRWSPDGRYLLAVHQGSQFLKVYDFQLHSWRQLTRVAASYPNWSADGKCVTYMWVLKQYRVCLTDGRVRLAAESGSGWPVGPGGWRLVDGARARRCHSRPARYKHGRNLFAGHKVSLAAFRVFQWAKKRPWQFRCSKQA